MNRMSKKDFFINLFLIFSAMAIHAGWLSFSKTSEADLKALASLKEVAKWAF